MVLPHWGRVVSHAPAQLVSLRGFRASPVGLFRSGLVARAQAEPEVFLLEASDLQTEPGEKRLRLDSFLSERLPQFSRARLQASIKAGLVAVNGRPQTKGAYGVRPADVVAARVLPPPPLRAEPEAIPLDVFYEDEHLIVVNKPAGMVTHPSAGHASGTLVNALLHHCRLPAIGLGPSQSDEHGSSAAAPQLEELGLLSDDDSDAEDGADASDGDRWAARGAGGLLLLARGAAGGAGSGQAALRPGIVHRLDRGTTGLLVVAKTDLAHAGLAQQFKDRSISRVYVSITLGTPRPPAGRVATNIGRDLRDRKRMAAFAYGGARGRTAASNYAVLESLAGGAAALVEWRLDTGRTHQIRVHARHLRHPLLGDETYGGAGAGAAAGIARARGARGGAAAHAALAALGRPALHARALGFLHPATGERLAFETAVLPADLELAAALLRELG